MSRRVLLFFPHNPTPPKSGAHVRCLQMIEGLVGLGVSLTLASSTLYSETTWNDEAVRALKALGVREVHVHRPTFSERLALMIKSRWDRLAGRNRGIFTSSPSGLRRWFSRIKQELDPDVTIISYAMWHDLRGPDDSGVSAIDTYEFVTVTDQMTSRLRSAFGATGGRVEEVDPAALIENFFSDIRPAPEELSIYDSCDYTIAISPVEARTIEASCPNTKTIYLPMTFEVREIANSYGGPVIYTTGPNLFNLQGYLYFARRVLPRVLKESPEFELLMTGSVTAQVRPAQGVRMERFIPDLAPTYASAAFAISPLLIVAGQQVKVVEAMAYGLPVVALEFAAEGSPIRHGENGLLAKDAEEFAQCVLTLWNDRVLCRRLGDEARLTVAERFPSTRFRTELLAGIPELSTFEG